MADLDEIRSALADLDEDRTIALVDAALKNGVPAMDVLRVCQEGMVEVGNRFEKDEYFVSDLMMSGEIFKQISVILEPGLKGSDAVSAGAVVVGTVKGDIHDIGKDIVVNMLKSANFEVHDLGVDVPPERFVAALKESGARVLGLSGLLTLAFDSMKETIVAVKAAGMADRVRVMIGGGPVDATVCRVVGADAWSPDAQGAVRLARGWMEEVHG